MDITPFLNAYDSLVFCDAKANHFKHLRLIQIIFEEVSELHVNWRKSMLFPVKEIVYIQVLAATLGCEVVSLPTTYPGLSLGSKAKAHEIWNRVLERCEKRLAIWKSQYLSMGGRVIF